MSATQQHLHGTCHARHLGSPDPPSPGTQDVRVAREHRRFLAAPAERPARGRTRDAPPQLPTR
ncbi:hypothetical protein [Streptomyces sp. Root369]|uniref:hypothetical protein n=1 Tax=Streptomyces sp. Root369 TaxID=1736523 RepID=UPI00070D0B5E|nr:hypothetical protein [Streptomyces sp. Root369]KQW09575.1 hypothetical protein ASD08_39710 [Streptomyces sp. Root369]